MTKLWQGMSFEKGSVKHGDDEQEFVIGMTEDEYKDESYREYLQESIKEKTQKEMEARPPKQIDARKREELGLMWREILEHKRRKRESPNRKYF